MIDVRLDAGWRVRLTAAFHVPGPKETVWKIISDFPRFVCTDHFHRRVEFTKGCGGAGTQFTIEHRFLWIRVNRQGRILRWRDGVGYAYSDLSQRNPRSAFPHVFFVNLTDVPSGSLVTIQINGLWTTKFVGRPLTRAWLWWNLIAIRYGVEIAILNHGGWSGKRFVC